MGIKKFFRKNFENFKEIFLYNTNTHYIEQYLMDKCGYWPGNPLCIWKIFIIVFFQLVITLFPGINYLLNSIRRGDSKDFALVAPEVLIDIQQSVSFFNFIVFYDVIRKFQEVFDREWSRHDELKDWNTKREKTAKFCNRVSFFNHVNMHMTGLVYFIVPTLIFFVKFYFKIDENVEKKTQILVEWVWVN